MLRLFLTYLHIALITCLLALPTVAPADEEAAYKTQIKKLQKEVDAIQKSIASQQSKRGAEVSKLRESELQIAGIAKQMRTIGTQSQAARREIDKLDTRAGEIQDKLQTHRESLDLLIKTAYQTGRTPRLQLLLNQREPALLSRMFTYYNHFNLARQREIQRAKQLLDELAEVRATQERETQKLQAAHDALQEQHVAMQEARKNRKVTLAQIEKALSSESSKLTRLQRDQRDLEALLEKLNEVFADIPDHPLEKKPFKNLKGKLPWPAQGKLKAKYNSLKGTANLRWKGMFIGAKRGNNVRVIYYGQVAFADWMNGFGLVLIVDHGDGYMSIYANNEELHKSQGEWVTPGDVIATVGDSGGQTSSGVYFELRRNGRPINPHKWVKKSIKSVSIQ